MVARRIRALASGRNLLIVLALTIAAGASFGVFFTPAYQQASGGAVPFDMQFPLTAQMVGVQLALLTPESAVAYLRFMIADFVFPPLNGFFLALLWAWLVMHLQRPWFDGIYDAGFWIVPFLPAAADLTENVLFYRIVVTAPDVLPESIDTALAAHDLKLRLLSVVMVITASLLMMTVATALSRRFTAR